MKKISPSQLREAQYRNLEAGRYMLPDDSTTIIGDAIKVVHQPNYFLYGKFIRLASPMDLTRFKPATLPSLTTDTVREMQLKSGDNLFCEVVQTTETISNIVTRVKARYEEILMLAAISLCEIEYACLPIDDEIFSVNPVFNDIFEDFTKSINSNSDDVLQNLEHFLIELHDMTVVKDPEIEKVAKLFLSIFHNLILNFFISFAPVFELDWDFRDIQYRSKYANLSPKAFVTTIFFDLEKSYLNFFTRKFRDSSLEFVDPNEKTYIPSNLIKLFDDIEPLSINKELLATIESTFIELATLIVFKHVLLPRVNHDTYSTLARDIKVHYSVSAFTQIRDLLTIETSLSSAELTKLHTDILTNPRVIPKKPKKKKRFINPSKKTKAESTPIPSYQNPNKLNMVRLEPKVSAGEFIRLQSTYLLITSKIKGQLMHLETLNNLYESIEDCLDNQSQISSPEVLDWYQKSLEESKADQVPEFIPDTLTTEFTDLFEGFDSESITQKNKKFAEELINQQSIEFNSIEFKINHVVSEINSKLQTLEIVIRRLFKGTLDRPADSDSLPPVEIFEVQESQDIEYIKSAFNGENPTFVNIRQVTKMAKLLGMELRTRNSGSGHLDLCIGDLSIPFAMSSLGKLPVKKFITDLYRSHNMSKEDLHKAVTEYLK